MASKKGMVSAGGRRGRSDRRVSLEIDGGEAADLNSHSQVTPRPGKVANRDHTRFTKLVQRALESGASRTSPMRVEWDISGNCTDTYWRELFCRPNQKEGRWLVVKPGTKHPWILDLGTRCRKCDRCRRHRAAVWRHRAEREIRSASRTWFATFTLRPERHEYYINAARVKSAKQGIDYDALSVGEKFKLQHAEISREFTLMLKRVRKNTGVPFKYLLVAEAHKSGLPHYHALFHERNVNKPLRYADLKQIWKEGFSQFKLVTDVRAGTYLCKYLAKDMNARVRASCRYGNSVAISTPIGQDYFQGNNIQTGTPRKKRSQF